MNHAHKQITFFLFPMAIVLLNTLVFAGVSEITLKQKDAVVTIFTFGKESDSLGSGFLISKDGTVVTNYHVAKSCISEKATCVVKMENGAFFPVYAVVVVDEENDLALIKVKGKALPTVRLAREHTGKLGESVVVIGSPKGLETTVSDGIVSAIRSDGEILQITAPISPGSSGSPVFNSKGEVIGVATFTVKEGQNLNFAIPIKFVHSLYRIYTASSKTTLRKSAKRVVEPKTEPPKPEPPRVEPPKPEPPIPNPAEVRRAKVNIFIQEAKKELSQKRFNEALNSCNEAIKLDSNSAEAFALRSETYSGLGNYLSALSDANTAIKIDPQLDKAYTNRALANVGLVRYEEAIKDADQALALNPTLADAYYVRSVAEIQLGNYEQALGDANRAISFDSTKSSGSYVIRGLAYRYLGKLQEALNDYNTALRITPNLAVAYIYRCDVFLALDNYDHAVQDCNEAIRLNPRSHLAHANRGLAFYKLKHYDQAYDEASTSLKLKASPEAYNVRCLSCIELKKYGEAVRDCTTAIDLNPKLPAPYYNRGVALYREGGWFGGKKKAIPDFQKAACLGLKQAQDTLKNWGESW